MLRDRLILGAAALVVCVACSRRTDLVGVNAQDRSVLSIAPGQPDATDVIGGTVLGERLTTVTGDTLGGTVTVADHVAGATVDVYREVRDSVRQAVVGTPTWVGSVVSASNGTFTLINVPRGQYLLDVTPPPGSPYKAGSAETESFADANAASVIIHLALK